MSGHRYYCTIVDRNYATRCLTLYSSLFEHSADPFTLWVLCMDDDTYDLVVGLGFPSLLAIRLAELEASDGALLIAKRSRNLVEYCWTCKPGWQRFLLRRFPQINLITYLDSDLFFFADPQVIFDEFGDNSILVVPHLFPDSLSHLETAGYYNAGLVAFRNDSRARQCLDSWHSQCLEWCYRRFEEGRFADQKYLDDWPTCFTGVHVLQQKGASLAPWNLLRYHIEPGKHGCTVDGERLTMFHFHGLQLISSRFAFPPSVYGPTSRTALRKIYGPYMRSLRQSIRLVRRNASYMPSGIPVTGWPKYGKFTRRFVLGCLLHGDIAYAW